MWPFRKKIVILSKYKYSDYLPVGTIVKLYNDNQEYMISRYLGNFCMSFNYNRKILIKSQCYNKDKNVERKHYHVDYEIITYPFDLDSNIFYILHDDVREVVYLGYDDNYRKNILNDIDKWYEDKE